MLENIKIVGVWELGWNTPIKEVELWEYPLRDFGIDQFYMSPITGISSNSVIEHADLKTFLLTERAKNRQIVFVDEKGESDLVSFIHPTNATYVFGKASFSPMISYKEPEDLSIRVTTVKNIGTMWPHQVATLVLYDRMLKG